MRLHSFSTSICVFACCLTGTLAQADVHFFVDNDSANINLFDSNGAALNSGSAMLGSMENSLWSYDFTNSVWSNNGNTYTQDELTGSQLEEIKSGFTPTLTNLDANQNGLIDNGGNFALSGTYAPPSESVNNSTVYLMISDSLSLADSFEFAIFVFRKWDDDSLRQYPGSLTGIDDVFLSMLTPEQATEYEDYYVSCILGSPLNGGFTLVSGGGAIPEPATATLGLLGLVALTMRRKR